MGGLVGFDLFVSHCWCCVAFVAVVIIVILDPIHNISFAIFHDVVLGAILDFVLKVVINLILEVSLMCMLISRKGVKNTQRGGHKSHDLRQRIGDRDPP